MQQLVLRYQFVTTSRSCSCSNRCVDTVPFLYESKSKALADFRTEVLAQVMKIKDAEIIERSELANVDGLTKEWMAYLRNEQEIPEELKLELTHAKAALNQAQETVDLIGDTFSFCGYKFNVSNHFENTDGEFVLTLPEIFTLEEWFTSCRIG